MRYKIQLALFVVTFSLIACSGENNEVDSTQPENPGIEATAYETPEIFREQLSDALNNYFDLKDALVDSDADNAASRAQALHESLTEISDSDLSTEARSIWNEQNEVLMEESNRIRDLSDVEEQRASFEPLSVAFIQSVEAFGPLNNAVYQQTCPMVGDGSADWLSTSEEILNPYHGDRMLNCGGVVRRL